MPEISTSFWNVPLLPPAGVVALAVLENAPRLPAASVARTR
jgi:hypothetical protein